MLENKHTGQHHRLQRSHWCSVSLLSVCSAVVLYKHLVLKCVAAPDQTAFQVLWKVVRGAT